MDVLRRFFPFSFKANDIKGFVVSLVIYIVVLGVGGIILGFLSQLPVIGFIFTICGSLLELYGFIGVVLAILVLVNVIN